MGVRPNDDQAATGEPPVGDAPLAGAGATGGGPGAAGPAAHPDGATPGAVPVGARRPTGDAPSGRDGHPTRADRTAEEGRPAEEDRPTRDDPAPDERPTPDDPAPDERPAPGGRSEGGDQPGVGSRRPPALTRDTARPEGGGRAAPGDAPAPARQWPLLTVLGLAALGLLVVGFDAFPQASRIGAMLIGVALLTGAGLRRALPSVGMLAVRSRFTDMAIYGLLGVVIVLLALMTQPRPWLEIPFLEDAVHFTVR
ncbi:DUF3017 domain-containing protein [Streptomyces sp. NPDC050856]|uniref:DUF3017 domain-containing protein n=1 Tax=Streptomyces sp. NPDC050856 TaxID=3154939 RepID=UPI0033BFE522